MILQESRPRDDAVQPLPALLGRRERAYWNGAPCVPASACRNPWLSATRQGRLCTSLAGAPYPTRTGSPSIPVSRSYVATYVGTPGTSSLGSVGSAEITWTRSPRDTTADGMPE